MNPGHRRPGQRLTTQENEPKPDVELSRDLVVSKAAEYEDEEALYAVEEEQIAGLPRAFASGNYGWRDAAWVVRWHYRRYLGDYPDDRRRVREDAFGRNDFEEVREAIGATVAANEAAEMVERLTVLEGVDVSVASAFLQFIDPGRFVVIGEREWAVLQGADELSEPFPAPPSIEAYEAYLEACRSIADRYDCDLVSVHRALWRLTKAL